MPMRRLHPRDAMTVRVGSWMHWFRTSAEADMSERTVLSGLTVYPVKGCRGIAVERWPIDRMGLAFDRRWMVVDHRGVFCSQRTMPRMALIDTAFVGDALELRASDGSTLPLPIVGRSGSDVSVAVHKDWLRGIDQGEEAATCMSAALGASTLTPPSGRV